LKSQNEELESQLEATREQIQQAKSSLDDLKQEISNVEGEPCHEDSASDLSGKADHVDSSLRSLAWFVKNVRQVCDGGFRRRSMYLATVVSETLMPSFPSSP
jgi:chromosome segregation ATPase